MILVREVFESLFTTPADEWDDEQREAFIDILGDTELLEQFDTFILHSHTATAKNYAAATHRAQETDVLRARVVIGAMAAHHAGIQ